jgi:charged multivesicular body protein 2A
MRENEKSELVGEAMGDAMDDAMEEEGSSEQEENIVNQVHINIYICMYR